MATRKKAQAVATETADCIVTDPRTLLQWSPTLGGSVNWKKATEVAADYRGGSHDDWRLPTIEELITLIDFSRISPATNIELFPDTKSNWYWSSTPLASSPSVFAWLVCFNFGLVHCSNQSYAAFVRAVRSSRASQ